MKLFWRGILLLLVIFISHKCKTVLSSPARWAFQVGTSNVDRGYGIALDEDRGVLYTSGQTSGSLYAPNEGQYDTWVEQRDLDTGEVLVSTQFGTVNNERGDSIRLLPGNDTIEVRGQGMLNFEGPGAYYSAILNASTLEVISGVNIALPPGFQYTVLSNGVLYECLTTSGSLYATSAGGEDYYVTKACASSRDYLVNTTHCAACPEGSNPNDNQTLCISSQQPTGQPTSEPSSPSGQPSSQPTAQCRPGQYHARGYGIYGDECLTCEAGTYTSDPGMTSCSLTAPGQYSPEGSDVAVDCPPGTYADNSGATGCAKCDAGTYANAKSAATYCRECAGYWWSEEESDSRDDCFQMHLNLEILHEVIFMAAVALVILFLAFYFIPKTLVLSYASKVIVCSFDVMSDYLYFVSAVFGHWSIMVACLFFLVFPIFHAIQVMRIKINRIQAEEEVSGGFVKTFPLRTLFPAVRQVLLFDFILFKWKDGCPVFNGMKCFPVNEVGGSLVFLLFWYVAVALCMLGQLIGGVLWPCLHLLWAVIWCTVHVLYWGSLFFLVGFFQSTQIFSNRKIQRLVQWLLLREDLSAMLEAEIKPDEDFDIENSNRALVVEMFFETIPQIILQSVNSFLIGEVTLIAQFSRACSIFFLCNTTFRFAYWSLWRGVHLKDIPPWMNPSKETYSEKPTKLRSLSKYSVELISNVVSPLYHSGMSHATSLTQISKDKLYGGGFTESSCSSGAATSNDADTESLLLESLLEDILNGLHLQDRAAEQRLQLSKQAHCLFLDFAVESALTALSNEEVTARCAGLESSSDKIRIIHEHICSLQGEQAGAAMSLN